MIVLTKRSKEQFVVNHLQIESIESIPEVKITMMNHDFFLVRETVEEIIQKIAEYNAKVQDIHREITGNGPALKQIDQNPKPDRRPVKGRASL